MTGDCKENVATLEKAKMIAFKKKYTKSAVQLIQTYSLRILMWNEKRRTLRNTAIVKKKERKKETADN